MRYRQLDANGDRVFGQGTQSFFINSPQAVAQAVQTRLQLYLGEWFLDTPDGTPWRTQVLGVRTQRTRDLAIRQRILGTPGVVSITAYTSTVNPITRAHTVSATIVTAYGPSPVSVTV